MVYSINFSNCTIRYDILPLLQSSEKLHLISVYRSPHPATVDIFFQHLQECLLLHQRLRFIDKSLLIVCGDFNIDLLKHGREQERESLFFSANRLFQYIRMHTTDYCSLLDHVWSNIPPSKLQIEPQECFRSDHVPILIKLDL